MISETFIQNIGSKIHKGQILNEEEIALLGVKPVLIVVGDKVSKALVSCLKDDFTIVRLKTFFLLYLKRSIQRSGFDRLIR